MKRLMLAATVATIVGAAGIAAAGTGGNASQSANETPALVLIGPVNAVNPATGVAIVLGQKVFTSAAAELTVGDTVFVIGDINSDGSISAKAIQDAGVYVPGSTQILLTGVVQKVDNSVGRVTVGGVSVDVTPLMATQSVSLTKGSTVQVAGTQPVNGGLVLANGIGGGAGDPGRWY